MANGHFLLVHARLLTQDLFELEFRLDENALLDLIISIETNTKQVIDQENSVKKCDDR
jgi:hypothetical protein